MRSTSAPGGAAVSQQVQAVAHPEADGRPHGARQLCGEVGIGHIVHVHAWVELAAGFSDRRVVGPAGELDATPATVAPAVAAGHRPVAHAVGIGLVGDGFLVGLAHRLAGGVLGIGVGQGFGRPCLVVRELGQRLGAVGQVFRQRADALPHLLAHLGEEVGAAQVGVQTVGLGVDRQVGGDGLQGVVQRGRKDDLQPGERDRRLECRHGEPALGWWSAHCAGRPQNRQCRACPPSPAQRRPRCSGTGVHRWTSARLALGLLEGRPAHFQPLLAAFDGWVASLAARQTRRH